MHDYLDLRAAASWTNNAGPLPSPTYSHRC